MSRRTGIFFVLLGLTLGWLWPTAAGAQPAAPKRIQIHMKTALSLDDAQICAVPNAAWSAVKAGHKVTILVDASAVTSVTKGFGCINGLFRPDSTALDRAALPERERQSLSQQMGVPLGPAPHAYGEYFAFLQKMGVEIYGNLTMMLLYQIDPARVASSVMPIPLDRMVQFFDSADRIIVY